jgi:NACalpha-BTF3-like transcription factor
MPLQSCPVLIVWHCCRALVERVAEEYLRKYEAVKSKLEERDKKVEDDLAYVTASVGGQGVQRGRVLHALKVCHGDVAEAIMGLKRGLF